MENYIYTLSGRACITTKYINHTITKSTEGGYDEPGITEFFIDLTNPFHVQRMVKSFSNAGDCAFFYQLRQVISTREQEGKTKKDVFAEDKFLLKDKVVIVDFESIFNEIDYAKSLKHHMKDDSVDGYYTDVGEADENGDILLYGRYVPSGREYATKYVATFPNLVNDFIKNSVIHVAFSKDENDSPDYHQFVVFDKSQSMARNSQILMIDVEYLSKNYLENPCVTTFDFSNRSDLTSEDICKKLYDTPQCIHDHFIFNQYLNDYEDDGYPYESFEDYLLELLEFNYQIEPTDVVYVKLPAKVQKYTDILDKPCKIAVSYDPNEDEYDYVAFYPLIANENDKHLYYIIEKIWNRIPGKYNKEKLSSLRNEYAEYQKTILDKRLNLGIDFHGIPVTMSKFYAYRGLYLSTSMRIEGLDLNEKTVVVIPDQPLKKDKENAKKSGFEDDYNFNDKVSCITNINKTNKNKISIKLEKKEITLKNNTMFDGEGFISPDYAEIIRNASSRPNANSFQIRMPFIKGVLHEVDFNQFLTEYSENNYFIKDYFGRKRDLREAKIILTESMFKAAKWINKLWKTDRTMHSGSRIKDPMEFFFAQMETYDHTLYLCHSDDEYKHGSITSLNYQILNTLAITKEELENLVTNQWKYIYNPSEKIIHNAEIPDSDNEDTTENTGDNGTEQNSIPDEYNENDETQDEEAANGLTANDDEKEEENSSQTESYNNWMNVLKKDPLFRYHPFIKNKTNYSKKSLQLDIAYGKIQTPGEIRFLSRDLLLLLKYLLELIYLYHSDEKLLDTIHEVDYELLPPESFYAPIRNIKFENGKLYPIFRNPHLSRNEQCALSYSEAPEDSVRYRYLKDLTGVIMVSGKSFVPKTLGGADFDGDFVKIYDDSAIRNAVQRGVYSETWERRLPIIDIAGKAGKDKDYSDIIDYEVLYNTFSNNVGRISNLAVNEGQKNFSDEALTDEIMNQISECAKYTILTGLEIDACKTGCHPRLPHQKTDYNDYVHGFYNKIKYRNSYYNSVPSPSDIKEENNRIIYKKWNLSVPDFAKEETEYASLSYLEYLFMYGLKKNCTVPNAKKSKEIAKRKDIIETANNKYKNIFKVSEFISDKESEILTASIEKYLEEKENYISRSDNLARRNIIFKTICTVCDVKKLNTEEVFLGITGALDKLLPADTANIKELLTRKLPLSDWPYLETTDEKERELRRLLDTDAELPDGLKFLYDFSSYGFNLLYLFLEFILCSRKEEQFKQGKLLTLPEMEVACIREMQSKLYKNSEEELFPVLYKYVYFKRPKRLLKGLSEEERKKSDEEKKKEDKCIKTAERLIWRHFSSEILINGIKDITHYEETYKNIQ